MKNRIFLAMTFGCLFLMGCNIPDDNTEESYTYNTERVVRVLLPDEDYVIEVSAVEQSANKFTFSTSTNLPLPVQVTAGIMLKGQKPDDDTSVVLSRTVMLKDPVQTFYLNYPEEPLPSGTYIAEVSFNPNWGAKLGNSIAGDIGQNIEGTGEVILKGEGQLQVNP